MGAPVDSAWNSNVLSDGNLNLTTYGQGTSFPSTWSTSRLFWKTDSKQIYQNIGTEGSPVWKQLGGSDPAPNSHILPYDQTISNYTTPTTYTAVSSEYSNPNAVSNTFMDANFNTVGSQGSGSPPAVLQSTNQSTSSNVVSSGAPVDVTNFVVNARKIDAGYGWELMYWGYNTSSGFVDKGSVGTSNTTYNIGTVSGLISVHVYARAYTLVGIDIDATASYVNTTPTHPISNLTGNNASNKWISGAQVANFFTVDMGSSTRSDHIAIKPDTATTTETQFDIQTSDDNATWTTRRRILKSALTDNAYNYIRFNPVSCRYVKVLGSSGNSGTMAIYDAKVKKSITDDAMSLTHGHLAVNTTDSSLGLDGTS
jgi:hypothetical protein